MHKLIMLIWNKEELHDQWKKSIVVPIHKKGDKTDCSNVTGLRSFTPLTFALGFVGKQESFCQGIGGIQTGFWGWGCPWVQTG
jgi:hypothetical protein